MRIQNVMWQALVAGSVVCLAIVGGCSDSAPTGSDSVSEVTGAAAASLTAADVIVPGTTVGAFTNAITPNESGWSTTEFWDNASGDGANCNVGFYAIGALGSSCGPAAAGSTANQGGFAGGKYWGSGTDHRKSAPFMFAGPYAYKVTLLGAYTAEDGEIGWFTKVGGSYVFHPLWTSKTIGGVAFVPPTGGVEWGFYVKHPGHEGVGCAPNTDCSDALVDMHDANRAIPVQQFALMTTASEGRYLVGIEDGEQAVPALGDDDFQDFLLAVEAFPIPTFVIGDGVPATVGAIVNFYGAQWWKNNPVSGTASNGVASFKGYTAPGDGFCGGTWTARPGNSGHPPATIPEFIAIIVTSKVEKKGSNISGDIKRVVLVRQDGSYNPASGKAGNGAVTAIVCSPTP